MSLFSINAPRLLAAGLILASSLAQAADPIYFQFRDLLADKAIRSVLDPRIRIYLANDASPTIVESAAPDTYTGTGISINPFGGSKRHCVEAFANAIRSMVNDAVAGGYDSILNLRAMDGDTPSRDPNGFSCTPAYKVTVLSLHSTFGATADTVQRAAEDDQRLLRTPYREPWEDSIYVALAPIADSPEAQAIFADKVKGYWGIDAPNYRVRGIPEDYAGSATVNRQDLQASCKQAVLNTLKDMVGDATERGFDSLIRIRSRMYEQTTPGMASIECEIGKKAVFVKLQGTLANRR